MEDKVELQGIYSKGYGIIAKTVMQDKEISITAKGIYSYLCSYCGGGITCFPSRAKICEDLNINKDTFSKHIKQLTEKKYITIKQIKSSKEKKFCHNIYTINLIDIDKLNTPYPISSDTEMSDTEISDTNNNNTNNKKEEGFSKIIDFYENNITLITQFVSEEIESFLNDGLEYELIIEALKEAVSRNKRNWKYAKSILDDCCNNKITTVKQFRIKQEEFKSNKNQTTKKEKTKEKIEYKEVEFTDEEEYKKKILGKG